MQRKTLKIYTDASLPMDKTMWLAQDVPADAIAVKPDNRLCVIAGRSIFKLIRIEEESFVEDCNLRVGKHLNLNYSCNDVVWNLVEDNLLATAATNGAVAVWDLSRPQRSKLHTIYSDHRRTVNKVDFHGTESNWLLSGSQDGTMRCFDLRRKENASVFQSNGISVRCVQFNPHYYFQFASVSENGCVQVWDLRNTERALREFTAHSGPVFTCDWHPETKGCLATAGRDKCIKVWNVEVDDQKGRMEKHFIQTIGSVGRVCWRPQREFHITSAALVMDSQINVWDVRRPFIPFAAFSEHKDVVTGIAWRGNPHVLLSTSKDCVVYQHAFKDATYPADLANPSGLDVSSFGEIIQSSRVTSETGGANNLSSIFQKRITKSEKFVHARSEVFSYSSPGHHISLVAFIALAKGYKLAMIGGDSFSDVCLHNAGVADRANQKEICVAWHMIRTMFSESTSSTSSCPLTPGLSLDVVPVEITDTGSRHHSGGTIVHQDSSSDNIESAQDSSFGPKETLDDLGKIARGITETAEEMYSTDWDEGDPATTEQAFMFEGDGVIEDDFVFPKEAFEPKRELVNGCSSPEGFLGFPMLDFADNSDTDNEGSSEDETEELKLLDIKVVEKYMDWDGSKVAASMLRNLAERGDVQTAVSMLLVLQNKLDQWVDKEIQEYWFESYIHLLQCSQLFVVAAEVTKLCTLPQINQMNQKSTTIYTKCGRCRSAFGRTGWYCHSCKESVVCCFCHQAVKGVYLWCQGCAHGGHPHHLQEWFEEYKECPTGCGHLCEFAKYLPGCDPNPLMSRS